MNSFPHCQVNPMRDECELPIYKLASGIESRNLSPVEITRAYLKRIDTLNDKLHAYITVTAEQAMTDAKQAETEIMSGDYRGALHGIPIGLKDLFDTAGILTTSASRVHADRVPARDADVVTRLRRAGMVLLGKLMMHEFATAIPMPDDLFPAAKNPWDPERTAGGSSSGSASALIAGMCAGALGTDTGGSIRGPASFCGIVGLKPTYNLVSRKGVIPLSWSLDHVGPMARTVKDCAILLDTISNACVDPGSVRSFTANLNGCVRGLRIGVPYEELDSDKTIAADIRRAFDESLVRFKDLGAKIYSVDLPPIVEEVGGIYGVITSSEAFAYHQRSLVARQKEFGRGFRHRQGLVYTAVDLVQAQRARAALCVQMAQAMTEVDVLASPTTSQTAPTLASMAVGETSPKGRIPTNIFNLTGGPSISVPCGFDEHCMPIGMMLSAAPGQDSVVLRAGDAYERETSWHEQIPSLVKALI